MGTSSSSTMNFGAVLITTFAASAVEAIEMVTIVLGVGATRGWRSTLVGAAAGFIVLVAVGGGLGTTLTLIPIDVLRVVVGTLLLIFGLQWLAKGVRRTAAQGFAGQGEDDETVAPEGGERRAGLDWTAFVLSFKGVLLEGLEIAFIVVTFGSAADDLGLAAVGGGAALTVVVLLGAAFHRLLIRIPRSLLVLVVGVLLSTFGTFWSAEGLGVHWPGDDLSIAGLFGVYVGAAAAGVFLLRQQIWGLTAGEVG